MNTAFILEMAQQLPFPDDARAAIGAAVNKLEAWQAEFDRAIAAYRQNDYKYETAEPLLKTVASATGIPIYTLNLLLLLDCCEPLRTSFIAGEISETVFMDTLADLCYKAQECYDVHGAWGNFVIFWYPILFQEKLFKLGRLEYERIAYPFDHAYEKHGIHLRKGIPTLSIHIPSCGPLTQADCLDSYRKAHAFFSGGANGRFIGVLL